MVQRLGELSLRKKFSLDKLSKVGGVYFKGNDIKTGVQRGSILKSTLVGLGKGKTKFQFEKDLKKYGVKWNKRAEISELAYNDKKFGGRKAVKASDGQGYLTEKQIVNNLRRTQRDRIDEVGINRETRETREFAGNIVSTSSIGVSSESQKNKDDIGMRRIGINTGKGATFAGGQSGKATPGINFKP